MMNVHLEDTDDELPPVNGQANGVHANVSEPPCELPEIWPWSRADIAGVVDESIAALAPDPEVFVRGGALTRIIPSDGTDAGLLKREPGAPVMRRGRREWVTERLSVDAVFLKKTTKGRGANKEEVILATAPPQWIAAHVLERASYPEYKNLNGVVTAPTMRRDASVLQVPGWDLASGLVYMPRTTYRAVPQEPSVTEAVAARDRLLDVIVDFPLKELGRAGWLAMLFSFCARDLVDGPVPLFAINAPTAGTGKTLFVRAPHLIAFGTDVTVMSMPPDEEELRKQITTTLLAGDPVVLLDNVTQPIGGDSLEAVITAPKWKARLLGTNEDSGTLDVRIVWAVTGNGLSLVGDMGRRTLLIDLESRHEKPEERTDYSHAERAGEERFLAWLRARRADLVVDALTCLRAWHVHGRQGQTREWGSFTSWASTIGRAVTWLGLPDPTLARGTEDSTLDAARAALAVIFDAIGRLGNTRGVTAGDLVKVAFPSRHEPPNGEDDLAEAIAALTPNAKGDGPTRARLLGRRLKAGRIINGRKLIATPSAARSVRYSVTHDLSACSTSAPRDEQ